MTQDKMIDEIQELKLSGFTVQEEAILGGFFGTVRQTDPAAGTMLKKGSVVTITIV